MVKHGLKAGKYTAPQQESFVVAKKRQVGGGRGVCGCGGERAPGVWVSVSGSVWGRLQGALEPSAAALASHTARTLPCQPDPCPLARCCCCCRQANTVIRSAADSRASTFSDVDVNLRGEVAGCACSNWAAATLSSFCLKALKGGASTAAALLHLPPAPSLVCVFDPSEPLLPLQARR